MTTASDATHPSLDALCELGSYYATRGLAFGSTGNLSVRLGSEVWMTPTGRPLRGLSPNQLAQLDRTGQPLNDVRASKEAPFHLAIYRTRDDVGGIVHLHSTHAVALSCFAGLDEAHPLPFLTPYFVMRVEPLALVPYFMPGSDRLAAAVAEAVARADALLLRNHGLITVGSTLAEAADRADELEETARLYFLLRGTPTRQLDATEVASLRERYPRASR